MPFFECYLPPGVLAELDLSTLRLEKDSFIDERLREQRSDLLSSVSSCTGQPELLLLVEHKSYQDLWTTFQVLGYVMRVLERHTGGSPPLPLVLAVVLYHGESAWTAPTTVEDLIDAPGELAGLAPRLGFQLCDLSQAQLEGLRQRAALAMVLQVLKFIRSDELPARLPEILALFRALRGRRRQKLAFLEMVLRYLAAAAGQIDEGTVRAALSAALPPDVGDALMPTMVETWLAQGEARGEARGELKHARNTLQRLLARRFGVLPVTVVQQIETAELDTLDGWLDRVLTASSLDDLFRES